MIVGYKFFHAWQWGRYIWTFRIPSKDMELGRFGGGWQIKLGFAIGKDSFVLFLLLAYLTITRRKYDEIPF